MWHKKSLILEGCGRIAGKIRDTFAKSRILQALSTGYPKLCHGFRRGNIGLLLMKRTDRTAGAHLQRKILIGGEKSRILRAFRAIDAFLMQTAVCSFGTVGVVYGTASAVTLGFSSVDREIFLKKMPFYFAICALCIPLLYCKKTLSESLCNSLIAGGLLFSFCRLPEPILTDGPKGKERTLLAVGFALLCVSVRYFFPSVSVFLLIGTWVLLRLLLAVPELCTVAVLFGLPFFNLFSHSTVILLASVAVIGMGWLQKVAAGRRTVRFELPDLFVLLFGILFVASGLLGEGGKASALAGSTFAFLLSGWFFTRNLLQSSLWRNRAIGAICLSSAICSAYGVFRYFAGKEPLAWVDLSRFSDIGGRVCATFSNPNVLSVYLLLTLPFFWVKLAETGKPRIRRFLYAIGSGTVGLCLVLTWSRGAWLGLIASSVFFLLCCSRKTAGSLFLIPLPVALAAPFLPHSLSNRFFSIGSLSESSIRYRLYTWRGVLRMLRAYPLGIGVGDVAFTSVFPRYAVSGTERVMHTHNLFLQIATQLGLFGLLLFLLFLLVTVLCTAFVLKSAIGQNRVVAIGAASALIGVGIMGFFDDVWYHYGMFYLFFAVVALLTLSATVVWEEET